MPGKVTVGLASHWPCVTDFNSLFTYGLTPKEGRWAPSLHSSPLPCHLFPLFFHGSSGWVWRVRFPFCSCSAMLRYYWLSICNTRFRPKTTKAVMNLCKKICVVFSARMNITSVHRTVQTHEFKVNGEWDIYRTRAQWKVSFIYHPCLIYGFLSKRFVAQCVKCNIGYAWISYLSLDTWSHAMLTHISPRSIEFQCCFYLSYCLSERVFSVVLYCRQTILICLLILYAFLDANK